jgi:hypothetical protein
MNIGVPQELGRPCHFHGLNPVGARANNSRPGVLQVVATGETTSTACNRGIAKQRNTERGEMDERESEHLIVPSESGNLPLSGDPAEGSKMPHQTTDVGNYAECSVT